MFEIAGGIILAVLFFAFLPLLIVAAYRAIPVLFVTAIVMVVTVLTVATLPYSIGLWVLFLACIWAYQLSRRYFPGLWKPSTQHRKPPERQGKLRPWPPQFVAEQRRLERERRNRAALHDLG
jgi:hypothetical protein